MHYYTYDYRPGASGGPAWGYVRAVTLWDPNQGGGLE